MGHGTKPQWALVTFKDGRWEEVPESGYSDYEQAQEAAVEYEEARETATKAVPVKDIWIYTEGW